MLFSISNNYDVPSIGTSELHNAMPMCTMRADKCQRSLKSLQRSSQTNGNCAMQRLRDRGRRWCGLRDLRQGAGGVRPGDRHGDSWVLPLDMRYSRGLENGVMWKSVARKHSQVVSAGITKTTTVPNSTPCSADGEKYRIEPCPDKALTPFVKLDIT
jgi:hypothetical protein